MQLIFSWTKIIVLHSTSLVTFHFVHHYLFTPSSQFNFFSSFLTLFSLFSPPHHPLLCPLLSVFALSPARSLSLSDKERFILSGSADCYVKIWALGIGVHNKHTHTHTHTYLNIFLKVRQSLGALPEKYVHVYVSVHHNQYISVQLLVCMLPIKLDFSCYLQGSVLSLSTHSTLWLLFVLYQRDTATSSPGQVCFSRESRCMWTICETVNRVTVVQCCRFSLYLYLTLYSIFSMEAQKCHN